MREVGEAGVWAFFYVTGLPVKANRTAKEPFEPRPEETHVNQPKQIP